jgi:methylglyoxal synthase
MSSEKILGKRKTIALVAHDHKKADLMEWAVHNKQVLSQHDLFATGTTGKLLEEALQTPVKKLLSGPLGGDQQIGAMIANGEIDMVFFFWDPMHAQPHDSDVKALLRLCVAWNLPMACDRATADFLMTSRFMHEEYTATLPDYTDYLNREIKEED